MNKQLIAVVGVFFLLVGFSISAHPCKTFTFEATLIEDYGTILKGNILTGRFSFYPTVMTCPAGTGPPLCFGKLTISHASKGTISGIVNSINVIDNRFLGTVDAIGVGSALPTGILGGVNNLSLAAPALLLQSAKGDLSIINSSDVPTDVTTWNVFVRRALLLPISNFPGATREVATLGLFTDISDEVGRGVCIRW